MSVAIRKNNTRPMGNQKILAEIASHKELNGKCYTDGRQFYKVTSLLADSSECVTCLTFSRSPEKRFIKELPNVIYGRWVVNGGFELIPVKAEVLRDYEAISTEEFDFMASTALDKLIRG